MLASPLGAHDLEKIWRGSFSGDSRSIQSVKLLDWNIERGLNLPGIMELIEREKPDICILQEVDLNARRTGYRNVVEELARRFHLNYAFGIEFQELGQGRGPSPAYHGQAILSRLPIGSPRILRFKQQTDYWKPRWYLPNWSLFQRRVGGRMALVVEMEVGGTRIIVYNTHLESRIPESGQLQQIDEILSDMARYPPNTPMLIAGDLNSRDPLRVTHHLKQAGFYDAIGSKQATAPPRNRSPVPIFGPLLPPFIQRKNRPEHPLLDWILARGPFRFEEGTVHQDVEASDHYPLSVRMSLIRP